MKKTRTTLGPMLVAALVFSVAAASVNVRASDKQGSMGLRSVMEKLGRDMQSVTDAISMEDWTMVGELSPGIARHDEPPAMEKVRILRWVGSDVGEFRAFDARVEEAADAMGAAAVRGEGSEVIRRFSEVQQACLGCHQQFRRPFVEHFYDQR